MENIKNTSSSALSGGKGFQLDKTVIYTIISTISLLVSILTDIRPLDIDPAWVAILLSGLPIVVGSFKQLIFHRNVKAGLLVSLALIACVIVGEYFAAGEIVVIMMIGEILEDFTVAKSKTGLQRLIDLKPTKARVLRDGDYVLTSTEDISKGDKIRVIAGESIPVDGQIIDGHTSIDQSVMTGESIPVDKNVGDTVFSATANINGTIILEATEVGENSSISKMIRMIKEAEDKKAPILGVMDYWATRLVYLALSLALIIGLVSGDVIRGITVLVVFCPCALVLATPTAIAAGIGNATKHGVIVKSGEALEKLGQIRRICFDKTGTLTEGVPKVVKVIPHTDMTIDALIGIIAGAEVFSEHPLGKAMVTYARKNRVAFEEPTDFITLTGMGVSATVSDKKVLIGNQKLISEHNIVINAMFEKNFEEQTKAGNTPVFVAIDNKVVAIVALADTLREDSKQLVHHLHGLGLKLSLLTGDHKRIAEAIGSKVQIDEIHSELLPEQKVTVVQHYEDQGVKVCMVGDGINDAPALKTAHVGVAMAGIGSDIAADSADIVLVKDDISKLPYVYDLSRSVITKIHQNIVLSLSLNFVAIALAAFGLIGPIAGALVHNVSSVLVVINAALLLVRKTDF